VKTWACWQCGYACRARTGHTTRILVLHEAESKESKLLFCLYKLLEKGDVKFQWIVNNLDKRAYLYIPTPAGFKVQSHLISSLGLNTPRLAALRGMTNPRYPVACCGGIHLSFSEVDYRILAT
jgi:hypothetical protein